MTQLIYFTAAWCGPCRTFGPLLATEAEAAGIELHRIDIDAAPEAAQAMKVLSVPTVVVLRGDDEVDRFGALSASALRARLAGIA